MVIPTTLRHFLRPFGISFRPSTSLLHNKRYWSALTANPSSLTIHSLGATFPYVWLRDSCQSPKCIHPTTSQKLHKSSDIPLDIKPTEGGIQLSNDGITIEWMDGHKSHYTSSFLERNSSPKKLFAYHKEVVEENWNNVVISKSPDLFLSYESLQTPEGLLSALTQLSRYGLLFVRNVPHQETSDTRCELPSLARLFGHIRTTFYGRLWDVISIRDSKNIAYTNLDLGLHMDLLYFQHPPRYQILHCLRNRVQGGTSIFVDAIHAASVLRDTSLSDFDVLTTTPVAFHYINDGHHLHHTHPTIELGNVAGKIQHINYSPPFQAPLPLSTPLEFYPALRRFTEVLNDQSNTYSYTLAEGDAVIFDNRRVLHARTAFSDIEIQESKVGEPNRWLKGCYLEADDLLDRRRILSATN
ncbi:hypothetical protein H0H92_014880 [Tricholoma furcatifolium]|nr:hypothetical protein H0H92_014880 [Tricholoma furcatifolium]